MLLLKNQRERNGGTMVLVMGPVSMSVADCVEVLEGTAARCRGSRKELGDNEEGSAKPPDGTLSCHAL